MRILLSVIVVFFSTSFSCAALANGFAPLPAGAWNRAAVERILHAFAYGGRVSEQQIQRWVRLGPTIAAQQMLTLQPANLFLAPPAEALGPAVNSLQQLQALFESDSSANLLCPSLRANFATFVPAGGSSMWYQTSAVQRAWLAAAHLRGSNPFRHKVGLWLTNYLMATSPQATKINLMREHYDAALQTLASGAPLWRAMARGAASAALASEYGHRSATYNNLTGAFVGSDDFAREFHQILFKINGVADGAAYHEQVTIANTARLLTGMALDRALPPPGVPLRADNQWTAPIDFSDHVDATGQLILNWSTHHWPPLEILGTTISGATAEQKLIELARVAILHPESLDNLPVEIIRFFGDDNLTPEKIAAVRAAWRAVVGSNNDLLTFLRQYAISTIFHDPSTFKYRTAFDQTIIPWNITNADNAEFYTINSIPLNQLNSMNVAPFQPIFRIFGHQTGLAAANDAGLFRTVYNASVTGNGPMATTQSCRDLDGSLLWSWQRDYRQIIPASANGEYVVGEVARWLWQRLTGDSGANYTMLERAHLAAILARRTDLATLIDPLRPDAVYRAADLARQPLSALVAELENSRLPLTSSDANTRSKANNNVAMAVNFIRATPFAFAMEGQ